MNLEKNLRYERKFLISSYMKNFLIHQIKYSKLRFFEHHQQRFVNSIYLDTDNLNSYKQNIDGLQFREKYRIRWYGEFLNNGNMFFEIKKKKNDLGKKIIIPLKVGNKNEYCVISIINPGKEPTKAIYEKIVINKISFISGLFLSPTA